MKIYDISQEIFTCQVYPGDPSPEKITLNSMDNGDLYNLTAFSMCAHNGTHIDAPFHFIKDGKTVDKMNLESFIGMAYVIKHEGIVSAIMRLKNGMTGTVHQDHESLRKDQAAFVVYCTAFPIAPSSEFASEDGRSQE